jgi:DNA polymerase/3'-5' exonuclease PolX
MEAVFYAALRRKVRNMSNTSDVTGRQAGSRIPIVARRTLFIGALSVAGLLGRALPVGAEELEQVCTIELEKLSSEWRAAGFEMPSKPNQMIVYSRDGRVRSSSEVIYMVKHIRQAAADCQNGNVQAVRGLVALVTERQHQR